MTISFMIKNIFTVPVIFHTSHTFALVCFFQLARKWPNLMMQWQAVEAQLPELNSEAERQSLAKQIKMISIVVMTLSLSASLYIYYSEKEK